MLNRLLTTRVSELNPKQAQVLGLIMHQRDAMSRQYGSQNLDQLDLGAISTKRRIRQSPRKLLCATMSFGVQGMCRAVLGEAEREQRLLWNGVLWYVKQIRCIVRVLCANSPIFHICKTG